MHKKIYILLVSLLALMACGKERIKDPEFGAGDYPRIYDIKNVFVSPVLILPPGQTANYTGLLYSPAGKVKISWKVNGEQKSADTTFSFTPPAPGEYTLSLEVEYGGLKSNRAVNILVPPPTYTLKPYNKVVNAYLSDAGTAKSLNYEQLTHVTFQAGRVSSDGSVDFSAGETNQRMDEVVARGHIAGKAVLLGLTGRLSPIDGWAIYEANDFGSAIKDPATRAALVNTVKNYVTAKRLDGVDVMMSDVNSGAYAANQAAMAPFINELKAALPAGSIVTATVGAGWQHWDYPSLAAATWVNVRAFEDGIHVGPAAPRGQASGYEYMVAAARIWTDFHLPADKLVIGIPAFGLRYNAIDANGNNEGWASYDYVPYRTILGMDPAAATKEKVEKNFGIYYNGQPLAKKKAEQIKLAGFKGAYLWAVDYDSNDDKSLLKEIYNALK